jgi:hypothetical protein
MRRMDIKIIWESLLLFDNSFLFAGALMPEWIPAFNTPLI